MGVSKNGGPRNRPYYTITIVIRTPHQSEELCKAFGLRLLGRVLLTVDAIALSDQEKIKATCMYGQPVDDINRHHLISIYVYICTYIYISVCHPTIAP